MNNGKIQQHYQMEDHDIVAQVRAFVDQKGDTLTSEDLAGIDQFHVGGLNATKEFISLLGVRSDTRVLDAGSGLGGPGRYVAETYGCQVTGVDLTDRFVAVSTMLAELTGMSEKAHYHVGDLLAMDFPSNYFDIVYTQHVAMNIRDRSKMYSEIRRVLKTGGTFGFYDVLATDTQAQPHYPVPWAQTEAASFLLTTEQTRAEMTSAGLKLQVWNDVSTNALTWINRQQQAAANTTGMELIMGPRFEQMRDNFARNLAEKRIQLVMATATAG